MVRKLRLVVLVIVPTIVVFSALRQSAAQSLPSQTTMSAQEKGEYDTVQLLKLMDKDHNGKVSRAEFMKFMNAEFDQLDINHDGELDVNELAALHVPMRSAIPPAQQGENATVQLLKLMDIDRNGKVSRAEFMNFMNAEFDRLDVNRDGELDVKELSQLRVLPKHPGGGSK